MYDAEKVKANRQYYLRNGRCPRCGGANPVQPGRASCRECALKESKKRYERRAQRREAGLCTRCGKPLPEGSKFLQCDDCRIYLGSFRKYDKRKREGLKAAGKCVKCGDWAEPGKTMCRKCLDRHKAYEQSYGEAYKNKKSARREAYKLVGLCIDCGAPTDGEHTRCMRCRGMRMDSVRKYRITKRFEKQAKEAKERV